MNTANFKVEIKLRQGGILRRRLFIIGLGKSWRRTAVFGIKTEKNRTNLSKKKKIGIRVHSTKTDNLITTIN